MRAQAGESWTGAMGEVRVVVSVTSTHVVWHLEDQDREVTTGHVAWRLWERSAKPPVPQAAEVGPMLRELLDEVRSLRRRLDDVARAGPARALSVDDVCEVYPIGRTTFDRWLADPTTGLREVVRQPGGPGGRVFVMLEPFEAWLRARGGTAGAQRTA